MEVIELVEEMQSICERLRRSGKRIRFIPTMGALHIGHASLIEAAASEPLHEDQEDEEEKEDVAGIHSDNNNDNNNARLKSSQTSRFNGLVAQQQGAQSPVIVVSIFTNPMQFDRATDFEKYPKTNVADLELCKSLQVDYVFMPGCKQIYPHSTGSMDCDKTHLLACKSDDQHLPRCVIEPPTDLNNDLEGDSRKGHFRGMLTIVCKLFNIIRPHEAYFGEKDYQQMVIVKKMVRDLNMNVNIRPVCTVRDSDLLPLSSRNVRLSKEERIAAPFMYKILQDTKSILESMNNHSINIEHIDKILLASLLTIRALTSTNNFDLVHIDYLQLRCSNDFSKINHQDPQLRFFDCREGCVRNHVRLGKRGLILKTRLLISCLVGRNRTGVRLLDNIEVKLNANNNIICFTSYQS